MLKLTGSYGQTQINIVLVIVQEDTQKSARAYRVMLSWQFTALMSKLISQPFASSWQQMQIVYCSPLSLGAVWQIVCDSVERQQAAVFNILNNAMPCPKCSGNQMQRDGHFIELASKQHVVYVI